MMIRIENIIYDTTRDLINVEDKIRIATIFIFCEKLGVKKLSELLYCDDVELFIEKLSIEYSSFNVDFRLNFADKNINEAFRNTRLKVIEKIDENGFLNALYNGDDYAIAISEIISIDFDYVY